MAKYEGIKTLEVLEGADNYNDWIATRLRPHIESPALEIGAGTGNISFFFKNIGKLVITDSDPALVATLKEKYKASKGVSADVLDITKKNSKIKQSFQTIYSVNVLEHIDDDQLALKNMYSMLNKGGKVVLLVPAKKIAYTKLDKNLGHFRRYEKEELKKKLTGANFIIEKIEYFNVVGLASWVIRNIISKNHKDLKISHVKFFDSIVPFLRSVEPKSGLPLGISLIAVASKK